MSSSKRCFFLASIVVFGLSGCFNKVQIAQTPKEIQNEFSNAPEWLLSQENEKGINAIGSAKIGKAGMQFAIMEAEANGRDALAQQVQVEVTSMIKSFTQQTGVGDKETVRKVISSFSCQATQQELIAARCKKLWISPLGEVWVLMSMPEQNINTIRNEVKTCFKNDETLHLQVLTK